MDLLILFLVDLAVEVLGELGLERTRAFDSERSSRAAAVLAFIVIGCGFGAFTTWVLPERVLRPGPFRGVSLIVVPALLGCAMHVFGRLRESRDEDTSHLATWYGGAAMGLGLSGGRLGALILLGNA
jgi:hypothetical protein